MESTFEFAKRPKPNMRIRERDKPVSLVCNLMPLAFNPKENFCHQYSIKFIPDIAGDNYPLKKKVIKTVSKDLREHFQPYFASGNILFSSSKESEQSFVVNTTVDETEYNISIEKTKNYLDLSTISSINDENIKIKSLIEVLIKNIIGANNNLVRFDDRTIYDYKQAKALRGSTYTMPGFSTSVIISQKGLFLKVYPKNKFMTGKTAYNKIESLRKQNKSGSLIPILREYFCGKSVLAKYGSYRVYKITDIAEDKNCMNTTILTKNLRGEMETMTLEKYYKQQYNLEIKNKNQYLLIHKPKAEELDVIYLIPELCCLTGIDEDMTDAEREEIKNSGSRLSPNDKMHKINEITNWLTNTHKKSRKKNENNTTIESPSPNEIRKEWGLEFKDFYKLEGRELSIPTVVFNNGETCNVFQGKIRYLKCLNSNRGFSKNDWICLTIRENQEKAVSMIDYLQRASKALDIKVEMPEIIHFQGRRVDEWIDYLHDIDLSKGKKMVFVVLDYHHKSYYTSLKNYLVTKVGIPSQFVLAENKVKNLSYFTNVLNQMVSKTGGELFKIHLDDHVNKSHITMIVGLDSCREGKDKKKYTLSTSYNQNLSKFYTQQATTDHGEEGGNTLNTLFRNALNHFKISTNKFPEYFIIYRSGGNDKQKTRVFNEEYPIFKTIFNDNTYFNDKVTKKFCYITVNKKTDIKFFQTQDKALLNPNIGTVIDSDVVHPENYDFYLQPQFVTGSCTATPVHYQCMYDSINIPIEILERITYWQTFLYWNWSGPIREPAALKFAEVCNTFNSKHLSGKNPIDRLKHTPYYI